MLKIIKIFVLLIFLAALAGFAAFQYDINSPANKNGADVNFTIAKGERIKQIGANLKKAGLIKSPFFFETYVWLEKSQSKFQAGEYVLNPKLNVKEIARIFIKGETLSKEKAIKVIEGWTTRDIGEYFEKENISSKENLYQIAGYPVLGYAPVSSIVKDYSKEFSFLADKPKMSGLEGYLFPDTYRIFKDAIADDVIRKMLSNFDKKLTGEMRAEIIKQKKTIYEIVTMASVIEKEVSKAEDMKMVSGIFWNRMKNGQALESCASLAYILGVNKPQYTLEDTKIESPYNTYKYRGLPPGPISNPGIKAITAAIYPTNSNYYFFLSRPDTGETVFSKTFDEHVRNKAKYLR